MEVVIILLLVLGIVYYSYKSLRARNGQLQIKKELMKQSLNRIKSIQWEMYAYRAQMGNPNLTHNQQQMIYDRFDSLEIKLLREMEYYDRTAKM